MEKDKIPSFLHLHRTTFIKELTAVLGLLTVLFAFRLKAIESLDSLFLGGYEHDAGLYIWLTRVNMEDLVQWFKFLLNAASFGYIGDPADIAFRDLWFNTPAFYPYSSTLAWSDCFLLPSFAVLILTSLGISFILSYNLVLLGAGFLNGYLLYRLAFRLTGKLLPAFIAGCCLLSSSFLTGQLGHPQLQFVFWMPLLFSSLLSFLEKPGLFRAFKLGFFLFLTFITTVYYAVFGAAALLAICAAVALQRPEVLKANVVLRLIFGLLAGFSPVLAVIKPYLDVKKVFGPRGIYEAYYFAADSLSYLSSFPYNWIYGSSHVLSHSEAHLFPGAIALLGIFFSIRRVSETKRLKATALLFSALFILAAAASAASAQLQGVYLPLTHLAVPLALWGCLICALIHLYILGKSEKHLGLDLLSTRAVTGIFLFLAFLFFALSLGPLGNPEKGHPALGIFTLFYAVFPGFDSIRAIGRSGIVVHVALFVLLALLAAYLLEQKKINSYFLFALLLAALGENFHTIYPLEPEKKPSPVFKYLKRTANSQDPFIVLPFVSKLTKDSRVKSWTEYAKYNVNYMNWGFESGRPIINGYSGIRSKAMKELPRKMSLFPSHNDRRWKNTLNLIPGLRHIVYVSGFDPDFKRREFLNEISLVPELRYVMDDAEGNFLFEYEAHEIEITDKYFIAVPTNRLHRAYLHLSIKAFAKESDKPFTLSLICKPENIPVAAIEIKPDNVWNQYSVSMPAATERVRPLRIYFAFPKEVKLFIKHTRYEIYK